MSERQYSGMRHIVFRTDASLQIGSGHVMRCLTLADALAEKGWVCHFLCREHPGHLMENIQTRGHHIYRLPSIQQDNATLAADEPLPAHAAWLGLDWRTDAAQCREIISGISPDWLVVDHYALDARWEEIAKPRDCHLLVIDDLADRQHSADLLLDQNLGRESKDYAQLVPSHCQVLAGPGYALLRPEFSKWREASLKRREAPKLQKILITMGGVDQNNATGEVLAALEHCELPQEAHITVVMGAAAPWLEQVSTKAEQMPWPTEVVINVDNMAERMALADLAIGAAGSTSWERCCLGLPSVLVILAENQRESGQALQAANAAMLLGDSHDIPTILPDRVSEAMDPAVLRHMSEATACITDGEGTSRLLECMSNANVRSRA